MMRVICLLLVSLFALKVNAQQYTKFNGYGFAADRMRSDSISIHPSDTVRNKAARSIAILNNGLYIADGTKWKLVMTDTTFLSNRINLKLNIADTINKWVTNVYKVNDSTIAVLKNGVVTNITINPAVNKLVTSVYNNTGSTIVRGSVVYISGRHSSNLPTIALAEANNEANSYKTFALVQDDIPTSSSGIVIQAGKIENLNLPTSQYTDGDIVYLSPIVPGGITITKPLAPYHICKIGSVTRAHPTQGSIEIKIENGWQLDELSDVQVAAVPLDSTILQFSRVDSLWHDVNPTTAMGNRFVKRTDSAAMLSPYIRSAGYGLSKSGQSLLADSLLLSTRAWRQKGLDSLAAIELNVADTANMLNPYTRGSGTSGQVAYWNATRSLTGSSTFAFTPTSQLLVNNSVTAASAIARGTNLTPTLTAAANNDVLVGLDVNPTFTNGAFTGVTNYGIRSFLNLSGIYDGLQIRNTAGSSNALVRIKFDNDITPTQTTTGGVIFYTSSVFSGFPSSSFGLWNYNSNGVISFATNSTERLRIFSTGNVSIGTATDAGFRLDVNGTARVQSGTTGTTPVMTVTNTSSGNFTFLVNNSGTGNTNFGMQINGTTKAAIGYSRSGDFLGFFVDGATPNYFLSQYNIDGSFQKNRTSDGNADFKVFNGGGTIIGAATLNASAQLQVDSNTKGFLPPRMTTAQRDLIATPAAGLIIYNTTTNKHQGYDGTNWNDFY